MKDLSLYHQPVTSMVRIPGPHDDWQQYTLPPTQSDGKGST